MKNLPCVLKAAAALFIAEFLFFACAPFTGVNYGTLVIALPGNGSASPAVTRAAVSGAFANTLTYSIECSGPGSSVSREARPGVSVSIPLNPGDWTVSVTALNAAGHSIGSNTVPAAIESGKTTAVNVPLTIDTSGSDITRFAVTGPVSAAGVINADNRDINVPVPAGTDISAVYFSLIHTGVSVSPASGPLDFSSAQTFTVTAENGNQKTWTVAIAVTANGDNPTPPLNTETWPPDAVLQPYGLSGLTQPPGTTVGLAWASTEEMGIQLENPGVGDYNALVARIEALTGSTGTEDSSMAALGMYTYDLAYTYSGALFDLSIVCVIGSSGGLSSSGTLILTVTNNSAGGSYAWPDAGKWAPFGLSGLTQPSGTVITEVIDQILPYTALSVTLGTVGGAAYDDLYGQISVLLGAAPISSSGASGDPDRGAAFMIAGTNTIIVELSTDAAANETVVYAIIAPQP